MLKPTNLFRDNKFINLKAVVTTFAATIITVGAGIWVTQFTGPVPLSVSQTLTDSQGTFNATGKAELTAIPDEAQVTLGVEIQAKNVAAVQDQANQVINDIAQALDKMGVEKKDIKTQSYALNPMYDYRSEERKVTGYRLDTQLQVKTTDFSQLNQMIDVATSLGANQVGGINFNLSEEKQNELKKEARKEAIEKAKDSAQELARLSGVKLGKVVNVTESVPNNQPYPMYARAEMDLPKAGGGAPTQIEPGSQTYNYQVTLSYETL